MKTISKYVLLQIPGWVILGVVLFFLWKWDWISIEIAWGIFALGFLKDLILYPYLRKAYEPGGKSGSARLIGVRGIARDPLQPSGYVQINGELWQAVTEGDPIPSGTQVQVLSVRGLKLRVTRVPEPEN